MSDIITKLDNWKKALNQHISKKEISDLRVFLSESNLDLQPKSFSNEYYYHKVKINISVKKILDNNLTHKNAINEINQLIDKLEKEKENYKVLRKNLYLSLLRELENK